MSESLVASRYRLGDMLGKGGMGDVYRATDTTTGQLVAVKTMRGNPNGPAERQREWEVRFDREVKAVAGIRSPHVVQVFDAGVDQATGSRYLVMDLLEGEDLARLLKRLGPLPVELAVRIAVQMCMGLAPAHAQGIVHRDIKPANVYLAVQPGARIAKVLDFGVARLTGTEDEAATDLTRTGSMVGSPQYMSPEQARGHKGVDVRADVWSVGVVLYKMLSQTHPFELGEDGGMGELIISICFTPAPPIQKRAPWVPKEVAEIVHRALSTKREDRFADAQALGNALLALLPNGYDVEESMLVPIGDFERAYVAPVADVGSVTDQPRRPSEGLPSMTGTDGVMQLPHSMTSSRTPSWALYAGLAMIAIGTTASALVLWNAHARRAAAAAAASTTTTAPTTPASVAPVVTASAAPVPTSTDLTVSITVPANATVDVDGARVIPESGRVSITGAPGTVHPVKISAAKQSKITNVVITADGNAQPSSIAFGGKATPTESKTTTKTPGDTSATDSRF